MFVPDQLRLIEAMNRFRYPPVFWERYGELTTLSKTAWFQRVYPAVRFLGTNYDLWVARQADPDLPDELIPFMIIEGQQFPDYYGFQMSPVPVAEAKESPVLVWSIHAYVHEWNEGFGAFLDQLQAKVAG